jgi:hypothetical protein
MVASFATGPGGGSVIAFLEATKNSIDGIAGQLSRAVIFARRLRDRFRTAGYLSLRDVACEVHDGVATFDARLRSHHLRRVTQVAAIEVDGSTRSRTGLGSSPTRSSRNVETWADRSTPWRTHHGRES